MSAARCNGTPFREVDWPNRIAEIDVAAKRAHRRTILRLLRARSSSGTAEPVIPTSGNGSLSGPHRESGTRAGLGARDRCTLRRPFGRTSKNISDVGGGRVGGGGFWRRPRSSSTACNVWGFKYVVGAEKWGFCTLDTGNYAWITQFIDALERPAFQLAMTLVGDASIAEEIVQEALLRVMKSSRTPRDGVGFRRWLYRSISNLARDHFRKEAVRGRLRLWQPPRLADPTTEAESRADAMALGAAINKLKLREREALYLRFSEEASFDEIGQILGLRETAARVLVHRAIQRLRRSLADAGLQPEVA